MATTVPESKEGCSVTYSLSIGGYLRFIHIGNQAWKPSEKAFERVGTATEEELERLGCESKEVRDMENADLKIHFFYTPLVSALPQEWLTGLSLGLIPSWGTRRAEYRFEFQKGNRGRTYFVDNFAFNHLLAMPFFWLSFLGPDPIDLYKESLGDFWIASGASLEPQAFSSLSDALQFLSDHLRKGDDPLIIQTFAAESGRDKLPSAIKRLRKIDRAVALPTLGANKEFPRDATHFQIGGHDAPWDHFVIFFEKVGDRWFLSTAAACR